MFKSTSEKQTEQNPQKTAEGLGVGRTMFKTLDCRISESLYRLLEEECLGAPHILGLGGM